MDNINDTDVYVAWMNDYNDYIDHLIDECMYDSMPSLVSSYYERTPPSSPSLSSDSAFEDQDLPPIYKYCPKLKAWLIYLDDM